MFSDEEITTQFALPKSCIVRKRIAKTLLSEHGAVNAADRKLVNNSIESIHTIAMLKPSAVGIAAWHHPEYGDYLEIAMLRMVLKSGVTTSQINRLIQLLHRAIPYPVVLFTESQDCQNSIDLSFAHKRLSQVDSQSYVLEDEVFRVAIAEQQTEHLYLYRPFTLHTQVASDLRMLYQAWIDRATGLSVAGITGECITVQSSEQATLLREQSAAYLSKTKEIDQLRSRVRKESQLSKKADINLQIQALKKQIQLHKENLNK